MHPSPALTPDLAVEARVRALGHELFSLMDAHPAPGFFTRKGAYGRLMEWTMRDADFKARLFRFVDVLPSLRSSADVVRHLQEYLGDQAAELNPALRAGLGAASLAPGLVAGPVRAQITDMARQFVAGEDAEALVKRFQTNAAGGVATTIDLLGETVVSEAEADVFLQRNLDILDTVAAAIARKPEPCFSDRGPGGQALPRLNLSVKISALTPDVHPADPGPSIEALKRRLRPILRRAAACGALVNFDMESYRLKDLTLALFRSILEEDEFARSPAVGIALQTYLRDAEADLRDLIAWARRRARPLTVRLVKGAYWDYETILARQRGWPVPVWSRKPESDANYEKLTRILLENADLVSAAFASHNVRSCAHAIAQAEALGVDPAAYEFQALFGMADELKTALLKTGRRVREYCPVGELLPGMAYFVRRLLENTSNEGFLLARNQGAATRDELLRNPADVLATLPPPSSEPPASFANVPNTDFTREPERARLRTALAAAVRPGSPTAWSRRWPLVIGGRKVDPSGGVYLPSTNPARPDQVIGLWARATEADADRAVEAALAAFPGWRATPVERRCAVLERAADLMQERRFDLTALILGEAGKPWIEADADVSEAIDFCRFYAREMRLLGRGAITQRVPGEHNLQTWTPRGVGVAIAPWNFPLAILAGLTVAPLVAGNTVIMKPAEQTPVIAAVLMDILTEAGAPAGTVNLVSGYGEDVGARLVAHPRVSFVAFTGSRAVGLRIWETAGRTPAGQPHLKKVVCEMGGKNALIIDSDADLDEAIPAALASAFGFSGQKCSALSRLIVLDDIHDALVERLLAAAASLPVGDPADAGTVVGPVIDGEARERIEATVARAQADCRLAYRGTVPAAAAKARGHYVAPAIFTGVSPAHPLAREEIFGPVLAVLRARTLDEAFAIANGTEYALTGGLFSRSPRALARAREELLCGNLYLNRGITGALVERHPFGGFAMSGGGTKAGGRGYLENFLFPRVVSENTLRRGFVPPEVEV